MAATGPCRPPSASPPASPAVSSPASPTSLHHFLPSSQRAPSLRSRQSSSPPPDSTHAPSPIIPPEEEKQEEDDDEDEDQDETQSHTVHQPATTNISSHVDEITTEEPPTVTPVTDNAITPLDITPVVSTNQPSDISEPEVSEGYLEDSIIDALVRLMEVHIGPEAEELACRPPYESALPYTDVHDYAYAASDPLHYGVPPGPTPRSRDSFSDDDYIDDDIYDNLDDYNNDYYHNDDHPSLDHDYYDPTNDPNDPRKIPQYPDSYHMDGGPPWREDPDLASPVVTMHSVGDRISREFEFSVASVDEIHGRAVALFDFEPENDNEAPLRVGQVIWVSYRHGQGWLVAEDPATGETGLVPEEYVRMLEKKELPGPDVDSEEAWVDEDDGDEDENNPDDYNSKLPPESSAGPLTSTLQKTHIN